MRVFHAQHFDVDEIAYGVALIAAGEARCNRIERRLLVQPFERRPFGDDAFDVGRVHLLGDDPADHVLDGPFRHRP